MANNNFILCLETTTEVCSVALSESGNTVAEKSIVKPNVHGTVLTGLIENILLENKLKLNNLSAIAYSSGPGSYTGLRIGLSVCKGICYGTGLPLIEVSTLKHMASSQKKKDKFYFPMIDARRMEVYGALLNTDMNFILEPFSCLVNDYNWEELLLKKNISFLGNGLPKSKEILGAFPNAILLNDYIISASSISSLADKKFIEKDFADLAYHVPFYLKEAKVTVAKKNIL